MNQDQQELTLEESVKQVMQTLPPVIREYLSRGKYTPVARGLMATYALRIDQGGVLEREIMLLLMGIENPDEFSKALAEEAKLEQKTINGIVQDVNEQIFVPLREQMRKGPAAVSEATKPAVPQPQQPAKPATLQASPQSAAATPPRPNWGSHASARVPSQPTAAIPTPPVPTNIKPPRVLVPPPPVSQRPALRDVLATIMKAPDGKQVSSEPRKLLEDHEEPHIELKNKPPAATPNITVPAAPNAASVLPKPAVPKIPPSPAKPYSIDPYREPLDEK